jgi:septal ring factor EnvC (AmiA/AmiB activator)
VWTGKIEGMGETLILDHGRDLHSVYARIDLLNIKVGDFIKEGTHLGKVAKSTDRMGSGLYFEIRENSLPTDPSRWILTNSELLSKDSNPWESVQ